MTTATNLAAQPAFHRLTDALVRRGSRVTTKGDRNALAQCPAHEDRNPSLSLTAIEGQTLLHCFAGCTPDNVLAALNLTLADLYDEPRTAYRYTDPTGRPTRTVHRWYDPDGRRRFMQSGHDTDTPPQLYRLPAVIRAVFDGTPVYIVEGEKDVHAAEALGAVATTTPMGASNWRHADHRPLTGAHVIVVPDQDEPGSKYLDDVLDTLQGVAASIHVGTPRAGKDLADHVAAGYTLDDLDPRPVLSPEERMLAVDTAQELRKLRARRAAHAILNAEDAANRPQVQEVDGAAFILDSPNDVPAIWGEGSVVAWAQGEALMICGLPGVGKTTIAGQLLRARLGIGTGEVLGMPVEPTQSRVLYLAMDRPFQIQRSLKRLFRPTHRDLLLERLIVRPGPPPEDLAVNTDLLRDLALQHGADTVFVDSLKDAVVGLAEDAPAAAYNRARQTAIAAGIEIVELHHNRKSGANGGAPTSLGDVYGSTWLTAGAGSVLMLNGAPGDAVVELRHLKQPSDGEVGPWKVLHDSETGTTSVFHSTDLVALARAQGEITAKHAASALAETDTPTPNDVEKARRRLNKLVQSGHLFVLQEGDKATNTATLWAAVEAPSPTFTDLHGPSWTPSEGSVDERDAPSATPSQTFTHPFTRPSAREGFTHHHEPSHGEAKPQVNDHHGNLHGHHAPGPSRFPPPLEGGEVGPTAPDRCSCGNPLHNGKCIRCEVTQR